MLEEEKILLIINPNSRKGKGKEKARQIRDVFEAHSIAIDVAYTEGPGHAEELAYSGCGKGYTTIISAGGDGSMNEVLNGIMKSSRRDEVKLGIIPLGRGNDYAFSLGLPTDVRKATEVIINGNTRKVDCGETTDRKADRKYYYLNGNGFGFEPMVNHQAMQYKHLNGMPSYVVAFMGIMMHPPKPYNVTITTELETVHVQTQQISVCLGRRMGSAFMLAPSAVIDDGLFDLMYTKHPLTRFSLLGCVLQFLRGVHVNNHETFHCANVRHVEIEAEIADMTSHIDGEMIAVASGQSYSIEMLEKAVEVYVP